MVAVYLFREDLANKKIFFYSDNMAVVEVLNNQTAKNDQLMVWLRKLVLVCPHSNVFFRAKHVAGVLNNLPDALSRFQETPALLHQYGMTLSPVTVPKHLLPRYFNIG